MARWAYAAGHLGEGEAWSYVLDAVAELHRTCESWDQLAHDHVLSHDIWAGEGDAAINIATAQLLDLDNIGSP